jgi:hypothetical protein
MQPYFFPYAQQFRHIAQCDSWIIFDTPKYSRKSWINRNRIADRQAGWSYISAPVVKGASNGAIRDAALADTGWRNALRDKLKVYAASAPCYAETLEIVEACIRPDSATIADLNTHTLREICGRLGIKTKIERLSRMPLDLPEKADPGEWALLVSEAVGADVYCNASGGRHLFDPDLYRSRGVTLEFYEPRTLTYETPGFVFTPDLSVIDTFMWLGSGRLGSWCSETNSSIT